MFFLSKYGLKKEYNINENTLKHLEIKLPKTLEKRFIRQTLYNNQEMVKKVTRNAKCFGDNLAKIHPLADFSRKAYMKGTLHKNIYQFFFIYLLNVRIESCQKNYLHQLSQQY